MDAVAMGDTVNAGDLRKRRFTLPQAARILNVEADLLRKKIDRNWVTKSYLLSHGRRRRTVDGLDIVFLLMSENIVPKARNTLYLGLQQWPATRSLQGSMKLQIEAPSGRRTIDVSLDRPVSEALAGIKALERAAGDGEGEVAPPTVKEALRNGRGGLARAFAAARDEPDA